MTWRFRPDGRANAAPKETLGAPRSYITQPLPLDRAAAADEALVARFWGVRGSYPTPRVGAGQVGGETTCLEMRYGHRILIIDAGSGAIGLGEELMRLADTAPGQQLDVTLLFTHAHHDHLCGLPFFAPLYDSRFHVRFFGPDLANMRFGDIIAGYMRAPYFPVDFHALPSRRTLHSLRDGDRLVIPADGEPRIVVPSVLDDASHDELRASLRDDLVVDALFSRLHPTDGTMVYRVSAGAARLVFATDVEIGAPSACGERRLVEFARDADALVHDAQYSEEDYHGSSPKRGFGHSTPAMAARIARDAGVGRLVLFHHDPHYSDEAVMELQRRARVSFPEVVTAREGLELRLDGARRRLV